MEDIINTSSTVDENGVFDNDFTADNDIAQTIEQDSNEKKDVKKPRRFTVDGVTGTVIIWVSVAVQFFITLILFLGVTGLYGDNFSVVRAIRLLVDVFAIKKGNIFKSILKAGLFISYLVAAVGIIKNDVSAVRSITSFYKKKSHRELVENMQYGYAAKCCLFALALIMTSYAATGSELNAGAYFVIVLTCVLYLTTAVCDAVSAAYGKFQDKEILQNFIFTIIKHVLIILLCVFLGMFLARPSIDELFYGIEVLIGLYHPAGIIGVCEMIYEYFVKTGLNIAAFVLFLNSLDYIMSFVLDPTREYTTDADISLINRRMILILVMECISVAAFAVIMIVSLGGDFDASLLKALFNILRMESLPTIMLCVGLRLIIPMDIGIRSSAKKKLQKA